MVVPNMPLKYISVKVSASEKLQVRISDLRAYVLLQCGHLKGLSPVSVDVNIWHSVIVRVSHAIGDGVPNALASRTRVRSAYNSAECDLDEP